LYDEDNELVETLEAGTLFGWQVVAPNGDVIARNQPV
jgi:hypothetical protein